MTSTTLRRLPPPPSPPAIAPQTGDASTLLAAALSDDGRHVASVLDVDPRLLASDPAAATRTPAARRPVLAADSADEDEAYPWRRIAATVGATGAVTLLTAAAFNLAL